MVKIGKMSWLSLSCHLGWNETKKKSAEVTSCKCCSLKKDLLFLVDVVSSQRESLAIYVLLLNS